MIKASTIEEILSTVEKQGYVDMTHGVYAWHIETTGAYEDRYLVKLFDTRYLECIMSFYLVFENRDRDTTVLIENPDGAIHPHWLLTFTYLLDTYALTRLSKNTWRVPISAVNSVLQIFMNTLTSSGRHVYGK